MKTKILMALLLMHFIMEAAADLSPDKQKKIERIKSTIERLGSSSDALGLIRYSLLFSTLYFTWEFFSFIFNFRDELWPHKEFPQKEAIALFLAPISLAGRSWLWNHQQVLNEQIKDLEDEIKQLEAAPVN